MKKLKVLIVVAGLMIAGSTSAQTKIGYISLDNMVGLMPETVKIIDTLLPRFQSDSLNPQLTYLVSEYNRKDSMVNTRDSVNRPPQVRAQIRAEMDDIANTVQNWQSYVQQVLEAKRDQLLAPVYRRVYDAIKEVAKEKGYSHVFNKEAFLIAPEGDDLITAVAAKLKVKLPPAQPAGGARN